MECAQVQCMHGHLLSQSDCRARYTTTQVAYTTTQMRTCPEVASQI